MARASLDTLLSSIDTSRTNESAPEALEQSQAAPERVSESPATEAEPVDAAERDQPDAGRAAPVGRARGARRAPAPAKPQAASGPRYLELVRKEVRFDDAQLDQLTLLTRQLNKARRGSGERITDNTLIRVAVDLLLQQHRDDLAGTTEEELRASVGL